MKIKNAQVLSFLNGTMSVKKKRVPVCIGFALSMNIAALEDAANAYNGQVEKLTREHAELDKEGNPVTVDNGARYKFATADDARMWREELNSLLNMETEAKLQMISRADLEKCDSEKYDSLTVNEISAMQLMIG